MFLFGLGQNQHLTFQARGEPVTRIAQFPPSTECSTRGIRDLFHNPLPVPNTTNRHFRSHLLKHPHPNRAKVSYRKGVAGSIYAVDTGDSGDLSPCGFQAHSHRWNARVAIIERWVEKGLDAPITHPRKVELETGGKHRSSSFRQVRR